MTPATILSTDFARELHALREEKIWLLLALHMITGQSVLKFLQSPIANPQS